MNYQNNEFNPMKIFDNYTLCFLNIMPIDAPTATSYALDVEKLGKKRKWKRKDRFLRK